MHDIARSWTPTGSLGSPWFGQIDGGAIKGLAFVAPVTGAETASTHEAKASEIAALRLILPP